MFLCVLENCEFVGSENNFVIVEGYLFVDKNWVYKYLLGFIKFLFIFFFIEDFDFLMFLDLESWD